MPVPTLPVGKMRVVIVDNDVESASTLAETLRAKTDYEVMIKASPIGPATWSSCALPELLIEIKAW